MTVLSVRRRGEIVGYTMVDQDVFDALRATRLLMDTKGYVRFNRGRVKAARVVAAFRREHMPYSEMDRAA